MMPEADQAAWRAPDGAVAIAGWWSDKRYLWALILLSALPLAWPTLPPLTDALGHMARYHVQLNLHDSPHLGQWFDFKWALLGNLGVDLLVIPLSKIFGLVLAVKLIVMAIPPLTVAGLLLVAREVHGRVPPAAAFAAPLAYGYPFQFGFLNHVLSVAFALLAFALWLRLGRAGRFRLRAVLFVPIGALVWLTHIYGWGVLGLLCAAGELVRDRRAGGSRFHALWQSALAMWPLTPPILLMLVWRSGDVRGTTGFWFRWDAKWRYLESTLRDRWEWFDQASIALLAAIIIGTALVSLALWLLRVDRRPRWGKSLAIAAIVLAATFVLLPRVLIGSAYADMRLVPYIFAVALIAIAPPRRSRRLAGMVALAAAAFFLVRTAATTISFARYQQAYDAQLSALRHIPVGARVMVLVKVKCEIEWMTPRMDHLGSQVIVQRDGFANGQWTMPGAQLLSVHYPEAGRFALDPTQILRPRPCRARNEPIFQDTLANFPRGAYDYFWLINLPRAEWPAPQPDLVPVWNGGTSGILYRINRTPSAGSARISPAG
jgi:hypothetical protein